MIETPAPLIPPVGEDDPWQPCPFCGGKAEKVGVEEPSNVGGYVVACVGCHASTAVVFPIKESPDGHLSVLWNRRDDTLTRQQHADQKKALKRAAAEKRDWKRAAETHLETITILRRRALAAESREAALRAELAQEKLRCEIDMARLINMEGDLLKQRDDLRAELDAWSIWTQFVFLGGGPVMRSDDDQQQAVCRAYEQWKLGALLKDRTRQEIRGRVRAGESTRLVAADFGVPVELVDVIASWQMFEDESDDLATARQEIETLKQEQAQEGPWTCRCGQDYSADRSLCDLCGATRWWKNATVKQEQGK